MELMTSYLVPFLTVIILLLTRIYFVLPKRIKVLNKTKRTKPCKTCIVLGSGIQYRYIYFYIGIIKQSILIGGHTAEMLQLIKSLDPERYTPRSYIVANTDKLSEEKAIEYEQSLIKVIQKRTN